MVSVEIARKQTEKNKEKLMYKLEKQIDRAINNSLKKHTMGMAFVRIDTIPRVVYDEIVSKYEAQGYSVKRYDTLDKILIQW